MKTAASTLRETKTYLGAQFRRLRTKLGAPIAIKAIAAKLARLVYRMLRYGMKYVDQGAAVYEAQHRQLRSSSSSGKLSQFLQHKGGFLRRNRKAQQEAKSGIRKMNRAMRRELYRGRETL